MEALTHKNIIPIVFSIDNRVELPAAVCISSLLKHATPETFYDIYILHSKRRDFSNSIINSIPEHYPNCDISFRAVSEFEGAYQIRGITEAAYYRLLIPELIPEYDKVIYSDVDVIFRSDLTAFYKIDICNAFYGAVDISECMPTADQAYCTNMLHLDLKYGYFNSGMLLINCRELLEGGKIDEFRRLGEKKFKMQDQDIINIVCNQAIYRMPPAFNLTNYMQAAFVNGSYGVIYPTIVAKESLKTGTIHYNGAKPWKEPCLNMDIWWSYYRMSPFFDEKYYYNFWDTQRKRMELLSLIKRIKLLLRYPLDRKTW